MTGEKAEAGQAVKAAIQMAIQQQAQQRLKGYNVTLVCEDTKCSDVSALWAARRLALRGVDAIIGDLCSEASLGALGVANKYRIPIISPGSTSPALSIKGNYFFRTVPSDNWQGQFAAQQMKGWGVNKTVVVYTDENYGESLAYNFVAAFSRSGGEVAPVAVRPGSSHGAAIKDVLAQIKKSGATGLFIATGNLTLGAEIIKAVRASAPKIKIYTGDSLMYPTVASKAGGAAAAAGVRGTVMWATPEFQAEFKRQATDIVDVPVTFVGKAANAYDAAVALMDASRRAQEPKGGPQIRSALFNVKFTGKSGAVAFDELGDLVYDPATAYSVAEFGKDGAVKAAAAAARR